MWSELVLDGFSWVLLRGLLFAWRAAPDTDRAGVGSIQKISRSCLRSVWRALLSGWQENHISHHPKQLISLPSAQFFSRSC